MINFANSISHTISRYLTIAPYLCEKTNPPIQNTKVSQPPWNIGCLMEVTQCACCVLLLIWHNCHNRVILHIFVADDMLLIRPIEIRRHINIQNSLWCLPNFSLFILRSPKDYWNCPSRYVSDPVFMQIDIIRHPWMHKEVKFTISTYRALHKTIKALQTTFSNTYYQKNFFYFD